MDRKLSDSHWQVHPAFPGSVPPLLRTRAFQSVEDVRRVRKFMNDHIEGFLNRDSILSALIRRLDNLHQVYTDPGCRLLMGEVGGVLIGCVGVGTFRGLPMEEKIGEVRDLVVDPVYPGMGYGRGLLQECLLQARDLGYQRLYLEMSDAMHRAQRLFQNAGFRPVEEKRRAFPGVDSLPCYYLLEALDSHPTAHLLVGDQDGQIQISRDSETPPHS